LQKPTGCVRTARITTRALALRSWTTRRVCDVSSCGRFLCFGCLLGYTWFTGMLCLLVRYMHMVHSGAHDLCLDANLLAHGPDDWWCLPAGCPRHGAAFLMARHPPRQSPVDSSKRASMISSNCAKCTSVAILVVKCAKLPCAELEEGSGGRFCHSQRPRGCRRTHRSPSCVLWGPNALPCHMATYI
jgi:hypothetical protein